MKIKLKNKKRCKNKKNEIKVVEKNNIINNKMLKENYSIYYQYEHIFMMFY